MAMNEILMRQLSLDYCCKKEDLLDRKNHFQEHSFLSGRRRFQEGEKCFLKVAVVNGKLLFCGERGILSWCKERYGEETGAWFLEYKNLRELDERLGKEGYQVEMAHPFFLAETMTEVPASRYEITWYEGKEIEGFRGDTRFGEAYAFDPYAPDVLGVSAMEGGKILGMAGASADSETMWQIGINVEQEARGRGIGVLLVTLLKNEILRRGKLPFYGTSMSHLASQRVALASGFQPAWAELVTGKRDK